MDGNGETTIFQVIFVGIIIRVETTIKNRLLTLGVQRPLSQWSFRKDPFTINKFQGTIILMVFDCREKFMNLAYIFYILYCQNPERGVKGPRGSKHRSSQGMWTREKVP